MQVLTLKEIIISGSIFIVLIAFLRLLLLKRLSKKVFITLWYVAALRLLLPLSMPSSFSIYNILELFQKKSNESHIIDKVSDIANVSKSDSPIFYIIWIVGVLFCLCWFSISYIRCRRQFAMSLPISNNDTKYIKGFVNDHKIIKRVEIRTLDRIKAPLTYGIFHPIILLPKTWEKLNGDELCLILEHELIHIRRFDAVFKIILVLTLSAYWFNPCVWLMYFLANRDIEYACDESVLEKIGLDRVKAYANMLIVMEERKKYAPMINSFSRYATEERICIMMKSKKVKVIAKCLGVLLVIVAIGAFTTTNKVNDKSEVLAENETVDSVKDISDEKQSSELLKDSEKSAEVNAAQEKLENEAVEESKKQAESTLKAEESKTTIVVEGELILMPEGESGKTTVAVDGDINGATLQIE